MDLIWYHGSFERCHGRRTHLFLDEQDARVEAEPVGRDVEHALDEDVAQEGARVTCNTRHKHTSRIRHKHVKHTSSMRYTVNLQIQKLFSRVNINDNETH